MIQRFIELGNGFTDLYEFIEIIRRNEERMTYIYEFVAKKDQQTFASYAVSLDPTKTGEFQPIYICREGITLKDGKSKRKDLIHEVAVKYSKPVVSIDVKHSSVFGENELYYGYLIALLRLNHLIPPLK